MTDISTEFVVEYPAGHPILQWADRRLLVATSELDLRDALGFDAKAIVGGSDDQASKPEQDAREACTKTALAQFQADRRWMIDLAPPEMFFVTLADAGNDMVTAEAGPAVFDPTHDGKCARQLAKRRSSLPDVKLRAARTAALNELNKRASASLGHATLAIRRAVEKRIFAAKADAENLAEAARAEIKAASALDAKLEFNRAAVRGAELALALADRAWQERLSRLQSIEGSLRGVAKLTNMKLFWVVPKAPILESP